MTRGGGASGVAAGDLARLVNTEQGLERRVADARAEGAALVASARQRIAAVEARLEAELKAARERFAAEVAEECRRRSAEMLEQGRREAQRFDQVDARAVDALAALVLGRIAGDGA